jgi:hypothetical protein
MTKTKIALAAALFATTSSAAFAQGFDPNLANRYPGDAAPGAYGYVAGANTPTDLSAASGATFQSAPVSLQQHRKVHRQAAPVLQQRVVSLPSADTSSQAGPFWYGSSAPTSGGM